MWGYSYPKYHSAPDPPPIKLPHNAYLRGLSCNGSAESGITPVDAGPCSSWKIAHGDPEAADRMRKVTVSRLVASIDPWIDVAENRSEPIKPV